MRVHTDCILVQELEVALHTLQKLKSAGLNGITNELLKYGKVIYCTYWFLHLINEC